MVKVRVLASVAVLLTAAVSCSTSTAISSNSSTLRHQATLPRVSYGGIIMAGGSVGGCISTVEVINTNQLPPLPSAVQGNTLTAVGSQLFSCGGFNSVALKDCYTLDTESSDPQWQNYTDLPVTMYHHTATAVGSHIWFVSVQQLYDLDTDTGHFDVLSTPFYVTADHCAVSVFGHSYIIGAGVNEKEVWINTKESDPSEWKHLLDLSAAKDIGCLLFENKLFVTGGMHLPHHVDIIDLLTYDVDNSSSLQTSRWGHRSFILDGKPAVAGGYDKDSSEYLSSIETYDVTTNAWSVVPQKLSEAKDFFGTAQLLS